MSAQIPIRPVDTDEDAESVQVALLRAIPIERRLGVALRLSANIIGLARRGIARARPEASSQELKIRFVEVHYGADVATGLQNDLRQRNPSIDAG